MGVKLHLHKKDGKFLMDGKVISLNVDVSPVSFLERRGGGAGAFIPCPPVETFNAIKAVLLHVLKLETIAHHDSQVRFACAAYMM